MEHILTGTLYAGRELLRVNSIEDKNDPALTRSFTLATCLASMKNHVHKD
ncbi:hypothetical protein SAMN04488693_103176 [Arthrobacter subterraneus]|uniref:Uncharacterized protein n=1 Tax=Arthrobacter subterraneus TaxID=335973 RepID=A0A1G8FSC3_9MICC|nr:hypothetical protein SAMN04488693_103176 [Arthrobacter subterraneus]